MNRTTLYRVLWTGMFAAIVGFALFTEMKAKPAAAMGVKDTRFEIESLIQSAESRSAVAAQLIADCNATFCDPSDDESLIVTCESVQEKITDALHLINRYRTPQ